MNAIRKFIVRQFALAYTVKLFGKYWSAPRASRITYPIFVLTGFVHVTNPDWPTPTLLGWFLLLLTATCLYIGFPWFGYGYFAKWPVKWEELDYWQKYQYGFEMQDVMSLQELNEWKVIYDEQPYNTEEI